MTEMVLIDDHQSFVDGMKALVSNTSDLKVVGEANDASRAYHEVERLGPDVPKPPRRGLFLNLDHHMTTEPFA